jgi:predicted amidophosphoribosyltransferase
LEKIYQGEVRVAQKSLSKLEERVENAYKTIFLSETGNYKRVLLIDDAVGSGATFNEVAKKLKKEQGVEFVAGFAAVGSYKGFEVIQEV